VGAPDTSHVTLESLGGWPEVLARLMRREDLTAAEAAAALDAILAGEAAASQVAAFAAALRTKGETTEEIRGLVQAMRARGEHLDLGPGLVDTCGTGGDRSGTVNVSSMAAVIAAAAGARVCKHGGRASSSISGSADVFEALGVAVDLGPAGVARCVEAVGIGFCLAPRFHPAMRHAAPVRRELGVATVFNFLGPLANPAYATRQLIGVGEPAMAERMLEVLEANGTERAMIVYGHDGLDELSTTAPSTVLETRLVPEKKGYERSTYEVDALELGLARAALEDLKGGSSQRNAELLRAVFEGERGPRRDFVLLNAAAALVVAERVTGLADGLELAASLVDDGSATATLEGLIRVSVEAKAKATG
jgi:anthranilate phosphoribosyltransferase